ncbi:hypothetical protein HD554DRAFT_976480 [Boletus coccyginus]|nr:hypothetical protein HD554DRAFT_976480 [Boletus coccyginus]
MIHPLFVFLYLAQIVQGASTDTTSSSCPPTDATSRSVWSILGSCALTLLICVWQAIHPDIPPHQQRWSKVWQGRLIIVITSFFFPEGMVFVAARQWRDARRKVKEFHVKGYAWSMTHSHFAQMHGFAYCDGEGNLRTINSPEFLELCEGSQIANPLITEQEIKDKSKSDALGRAILAFQLLWFTLQVSVRHFGNLTVTLVELDTVCMAVLTLLLLFLWRNKPLRPECPHIFYSPQRQQTGSAFLQTWESKPDYLNEFIAHIPETQPVTVEKKSSFGILETFSDLRRLRKRLMVNRDLVKVNVSSVVLLATWFIFGGLHLTAWNFPFVTVAEKMTWRVASLVLTGAPLAVVVGLGLTFTLRRVGLCGEATRTVIEAVSISFAFCLATLSRQALVGLMLASLRHLPCSAYQNISWTTYIPHF